MMTEADVIRYVIEEDWEGFTEWYAAEACQIADEYATNDDILEYWNFLVSAYGWDGL